MKVSLRKGFSYGLTSAVITTLGLMVGLNISTNSKFVVIGGVVIIAIADALSDSLGMHISEEAEARHTAKEIWESTIATFLAKASVAMTFVVPLLLFDLSTAVMVNIVWGMFLISALSFQMAVRQKTKITYVVLEHLGVAILVVIAAYYIGRFVAIVFG